MLSLDPGNYVPENFFSEEEIINIITTLRKTGKKIGLCTGSFDFLHPGHITHLISAKKLCDILVVAIAKDKYSSSKYLKSGRPLFSDNLRAFVVSKLKPVDFVFLEDGILETVEKIKPDVYIKGIDYCNAKDPNIILQKKMLESWGGKMVFTKDEKISTTDIIKHIQEKITQV